jgi:hypothetical protein
MMSPQPLTLLVMLTTAWITCSKALLPLEAEPGGRPARAPPAADDGQCFAWSGTSSVAREDVHYPSATTGEPKFAAKGQLADFLCEGVICPNMAVPDCFADSDACGEDEWCLLADEVRTYDAAAMGLACRQTLPSHACAAPPPPLMPSPLTFILPCFPPLQVRMGPWAMGGSSGETPNFGRYDCSFLARHNFTQLFAQVCRNRTEWGPWPMARGRCVRYRREQQSCKVYWGGGGAEDGGLSPQYVVEPATGRPPSRPLLCAPGLVCTGATEPVLFTCVKARPADVCYQVAEAARHPPSVEALLCAPPACSVR